MLDLTTRNDIKILVIETVAELDAEKKAEERRYHRDVIVPEFLAQRERHKANRAAQEIEAARQSSPERHEETQESASM